MRSIKNLIDILLHGLGAIVIISVAYLLGATGSLLFAVAHLNTLFWFTREVIQDVRKNSSPFWPIRYSSQKWKEFLFPMFVGYFYTFFIVMGWV